MKFDDILREIGEFGPYQKRVYVLAVLPAILVAFETMSVIFIFNIPSHRCAVPGLPNDRYQPLNHTQDAIVKAAIPITNGAWDECHVYDDVNVTEVLRHNGSVPGWSAANASRSECSRWVFDHSVFESTVATDFNVVCGRKVHRATSNMISELGTATAMLISGFISDRFGRKVPFYIGGLTLIGGGFGIAFTQNLITFNVCRFILSMARMVMWVNCIVIGVEIVGPSKRAFAALAAELFWSFGCLSLLGAAFAFRNWRYLEIAVSVPSLVLLVYWWVIPESPRWLISQGRDKEALVILDRMARSNKTTLPTIDNARDLLEPDTSSGFLTILRSRELVFRMLVVFSNMFMIVLTYYGLTLNVTNLSGDVYVNYAIAVLVEAAGYTAALLALGRVGRKVVYCSSVILAGVACVASIIPVVTGGSNLVVTVLSMVGRFFDCAAFGTIYLYAPELFPTTIRSSTVGIGVAFARLANILSPFVADLGILVGGKLKHALPLLMMGGPTILVGILSLWLPETKDTKMPETLDDVKNRQKRRCTSLDCCSGRKDKDRENKDDMVPVPEAVPLQKVKDAKVTVTDAVPL